MRACWIVPLAVLLLLPVSRAAPAAGEPAGGERRVTLNLKDVPLRNALDLLFAGSGLQYSVAPAVGNTAVTLSVRNRPLTEALRLVTDRAGATFSLEGDVYAIRASANKPVHLAQNGPDRKVTVNVRDVPLREAIRMIFEGSGLQYSVDPNVRSVPVSLSIRGISLQAGLRLLIRQAAALQPGLTVAREGDIFVIRVRPAPATRPRPPESGVPDDREPVVWDKIRLQFQDVSLVTEILGGVLLPSGRGTTPHRRTPSRSARPASLARSGSVRPTSDMAAPQDRTGDAPDLLGCGGQADALVPEGIEAILGVEADNSLLVRGTAEDIDALRGLLRMMDVPPLSVRVRVSARKLTAQGQVLDGAPLKLADAAAGSRFSLTVVPHVLGDGTIKVTVDGSVASAGSAAPVGSRARLTSGTTVSLITLGEGSRQLQLSVRAELLRGGAPPVQRRP